ncbi:MAG: 3-hexulose-6-phosphate isomerase [Microbacteriaceae bacterium]|jgi:6-phospho-3-hexuloisomerase|nr:3-hexulose-6-phosphate isomerase [Microbacteriaceae bacterium]
MGTSSTAASTVTGSLVDLLEENSRLVDRMVPSVSAPLDEAASLIRDAPRVFVLGAGRSGLALRMTAMRLMHLGLTVHVVGETTTPAIGKSDVLLVASGSGTTPGIVRAAETASAVGASIIALTTDASSALSALARTVIVVPAAQKQDHTGAVSIQYAGGLFEQAIVLIGDAIFHTLWKLSGIDAAQLWPRHANIE